MEKKITNNKFLKIICPRCSNQQVVYSHSSIKTKCSQCNLLLVKTSGGKAKIKARVQEIIP